MEKRQNAIKMLRCVIIVFTAFFVAATANAQIITLNIDGTNYNASTNQSGTGWIWNASSQLLTLNNYNSGSIQSLEGEGNLNLAIIGNCTVSQIRVTASDIILSGTGTLNVGSLNARQSEMKIESNILIKASGPILLKTITMKSGSMNLAASASINGAINLSGNAAIYTSAVSTSYTIIGSINISDNAGVEISSSSTAIRGKDINVTGNGKLITGSNGKNGKILMSDGSTLTVDGSAMVAINGDMGDPGDNDEMAIGFPTYNNLTVLNGTVLITGTITGTVTHTGGTLNGVSADTKYAVKVINGTGDGDYKPLTTVNISANTPLEGQRFLNWTAVPNVTFADANEVTTSFPMPAYEVTVTANYYTPVPQTIVFPDDTTPLRHNPLFPIIIEGQEPNCLYPDNIPSGNSITVNRGTINTIFGGFTEQGNAINNTVTIKGGTIDIIYGGKSNSGGDDTGGNSLNLHTNLNIKQLRNFEFLNFYLPTTIANGNTMLGVSSEAVDLNNCTINIELDGTQPPFVDGDVITLIDNVTGTPDNDGQKFLLGNYHLTLSVADNKLIATVSINGTALNIVSVAGKNVTFVGIETVMFGNHPLYFRKLEVKLPTTITKIGARDIKLINDPVMAFFIASDNRNDLINAGNNMLENINLIDFMSENLPEIFAQEGIIFDNSKTLPLNAGGITKIYLFAKSRSVGEAVYEVSINQTGLAEIPVFKDNDIKIYPNPVKDELRFESNGLTISKTEIISLSGKIIYQFIDSGNQINVSTLPKGVYFIRIETVNGIVTRKFVKE